jgi:hypothetical protein
MKKLFQKLKNEKNYSTSKAYIVGVGMKKPG